MPSAGNIQIRYCATPAGYFISAVAPAASNFCLALAASSLFTPSLTGCGAPSTRSLDSLRPKVVNSRTALITLILLAPTSLRITLNSVCSSPSGAAASAVGAAATASFNHVLQEIERTCARTDLETGFELPRESGAREFDISKLRDEMRMRKKLIECYIESYRQYCWSVNSLTDLKLAPFHVLATNGKVHIDKSHAWHMKTIEEIYYKDSYHT